MRSIWGPGRHGDEDGSTWLTAFVVKAFSEASEHIKVEAELVQASVNWLLAGQEPSGCFNKRGYTHSRYTLTILNCAVMYSPKLPEGRWERLLSHPVRDGGAAGGRHQAGS